MKKVFAISVAASAMLVSPALAQEFYIVRDTSTKECRIVEEKPTTTTSVTILGNGAVFKTRAEAQTRLKEVCKDTPSTTIIKER